MRPHHPFLFLPEHVTTLVIDLECDLMDYFIR